MPMIAVSESPLVSGEDEPEGPPEEEPEPEPPVEEPELEPLEPLEPTITVETGSATLMKSSLSVRKSTSLRCG